MKEHATAIFSLDLIFVTTGGGADYKDRQVAGYKGSLFFGPRKWLFIRSHFM